MKEYPLKLEGVRKDAIWGGTALTTRWGITHTGPHLAELWVLSDRGELSSRVTVGEAAGMTPGEALAACGWKPKDTFPLLCKLIDAGADLSVQVHPSDSDTDVTGEPCGKTEMWYVLEAEEGACVYLGTKAGVDRERLLEAMDQGERVETLLEAVPVRAGDVCWIPAGTVHALGRGVVVAEVQQNSDVTYRLYDYGRLGADGKPRELHTKEAAKVLRLTAAKEREELRFMRSVPAIATRCVPLVACDLFYACLLHVAGEETLTVPEDSFLSLLCLEGEGVLSFEGKDYPIRKGDSYLLPGTMKTCVARGSLCCLAAGE